MGRSSRSAAKDYLRTEAIWDGPEWAVGHCTRPSVTSQARGWSASPGPEDSLPDEVRTVLQPKYAGENRAYRFDFSSYLAAGEYVSSNTQVVNLYSGIAATPVTLTADSIAANIVTIKIAGGTVGNIYDIVVTAVTSTGQTISLNAFLPILPGQP